MEPRAPDSVWDHRVRQRSSYHLLEGRHWMTEHFLSLPPGRGTVCHQQSLLCQPCIHSVEPWKLIYSSHLYSEQTSHVFDCVRWPCSLLTIHHPNLVLCTLSLHYTAACLLLFYRTIRTFFVVFCLNAILILTVLGLGAINLYWQPSVTLETFLEDNCLKICIDILFSCILSAVFQRLKWSELQHWQVHDMYRWCRQCCYEYSEWVNSDDRQCQYLEGLHMTSTELRLLLLQTRRCHFWHTTNM